MDFSYIREPLDILSDLKWLFSRSFDKASQNFSENLESRKSSGYLLKSSVRISRKSSVFFGGILWNASCDIRKCS